MGAGLRDAEARELNVGLNTHGVGVRDASADCANATDRCSARHRAPQVVESGVSASCINWVISMLGAGQLTLSYSLRELGLVFGVCMMAFFAALTAYSTAVLSAASKRIGAASYKEVIDRLLGVRAKSILDVMILVYIWGGNVGFFVIVKQQFDLISRYAGFEATVDGRALLALAVVVFVWPLSLVQNLERLKFTSLLGCAAAFGITVVVGVCAPWSPQGMDVCGASGEPSRDLALMPASLVNVMSAIPLVAFAFNGSWSFMTVYKNLHNRTTGRTATMIGASMGFLFLEYMFIALFGFLSYCDATAPNIIDSLDREGGWKADMVLISRIALVLQLCLTMPVRFNVATAIAVPPPNAGTPVPFKWHAAVVTALLFTASGLAELSVPVNVALGITSAVCASGVMFIYPALCELALFKNGRIKKLSKARAACAVVVLCLGVFTMVGGTYANLKLVFSPAKPARFEILMLR
eukprot:TRINITY_DN58576_c0_g1_i1.p1 TRINITY_DN58576_c0_g1~~TRINITY_DN58576_c0_g1_i1.p1  ORF type:complete len:491 (+),score=65.64 TRINITY_DN58576_c0_g1_i1:72-1475(+)